MSPNEFEVELRSTGQRLQFARAAANKVRDELRDVVLGAVAAGMSEASVAELAGVDRMTVRSWRGK